MAQAPRDPELYGLTSSAVREAIATVRTLLQGEGFVLTHSEFPHLSWFDSGFPHLSSYPRDKINDYRNAYRYTTDGSERVNFSDMASFAALEDYCWRTDLIRQRFTHGRDPQKVRESFVRISADLMAGHIMDRFLHLHPDEEPSDELLLPIYLLLEAPALEDILTFDVLVPVVLTHFPDVHDATISETLSLRKLTDEEHLARWPLSSSATESVNQIVLSAATHAFVWKGQTVSAEDWSQRYSNALDALPWTEIDLAFDALRVVTGIATGYAQIIIDPKGWVDEYLADLPPLIRGQSVRRYPEGFENWGWIKERPKVAGEKLPEVAETLRVFSADPQLQMAGRRFSASYLRSNEDDAVVDLCTCLEILLTDDTKTEVMHKLRLRAAAVVTQFWPTVDARVVFDAVATIYGLRSLLLHGSKAKKKKPSDDLRTLKWGSENARTVDIARWIAQTVLLWTIHKGKLGPATDIDRELILDALTQPPETSHEEDP